MTLGHFKCPYFFTGALYNQCKSQKTHCSVSIRTLFDFFIVSFQKGGVRPQDRHERAEEDHRGLRGYG
jgi:hypothetical protein